MRLLFGVSLCFVAACSLLTSLDGLGSKSDAGNDAGSDVGTDAAPVDASGDAAASRKRIFFTSVQYPGTAIGGLSGADAKCALAVNARSLGGTFTAWLSDSHTNALDRIQDVGPWYGVDRQVEIFPNKAALAYLPLTPIWLDDAKKAYTTEFWTGTDVGGMKTVNTCADWGIDGGASLGTNGQSGSTAANWTNFGYNGCPATESVLCIEQ